MRRRERSVGGPHDGIGFLHQPCIRGQASGGEALASILDAAGFRVWFDEMTLSVGDSLRQSIERGIVEASFGIAIISPAFLAVPLKIRSYDSMIHDRS